MLLSFLFFGCEKDKSNTVSPIVTTIDSSTFVSGNVKASPAYFSFSKKDSTTSADTWDIKLTTLYAADDSTNSFKFPGIVLNPLASLNVTAKIIDGQKYEAVDPTTVTGLAADNTGFITYSTRSIKSGPFYFSFDTGDTMTSAQNWDVKITRDAFAFPIIVLNRAKNVQVKFIDTTVSFENLNQYSLTGLKTDANDTTFVIGENCFSYDTTSHLLSPYTNRIFILQTASGAKIKFRTLNYYNTAGASGFVKFEYYNKKNEKYALGTDCLNYNGTTHVLSPYTDRTLVVKTSTGKFAKMKMLSYYNSAGASGYMKFQFEVK